MKKFLHLFILLLLAATAQYCESGDAPSDAKPGENAGVADSGDIRDTPYPERAYWGDSHVHTGWSADAGMDGAITTPEDAYRFALGEEVTSNSGLKAKLSRPFDWFLVSDHSDGMGTINELIAGNPEMLASETLKRWYEALNSGEEERMAAAKSELVVMQAEERLPEEVMDPK